MTDEPAAFVGAAKVQTMIRDFDAHREAIRAHDSELAEKTWERCERWVGCINPNKEGRA